MKLLIRSGVILLTGSSKVSVITGLILGNLEILYTKSKIQNSPKEDEQNKTVTSKTQMKHKVDH